MLLCFVKETSTTSCSSIPYFFSIFSFSSSASPFPPPPSPFTLPHLLTLPPFPPHATSTFHLPPPLHYLTSSSSLPSPTLPSLLLIGCGYNWLASDSAHPTTGGKFTKQSWKVQLRRRIQLQPVNIIPLPLTFDLLFGQRHLTREAKTVDG